MPRPGKHDAIERLVIANKKSWSGLPADIQLEAAMKEATRYADSIAKLENDEALEGETWPLPRRGATLAFRKLTVAPRVPHRTWICMHRSGRRVE